MINLFRCTKPNMIPVHVDTLTPIDEEPAEDNEEDQPITMIPKIMRTAPSPTTEQPPTNGVQSNDQDNDDSDDTKLNEIPNNNKNSTNKPSSVPAVTINNGGSPTKDVNQIESVL